MNDPSGLQWMIPQGQKVRQVSAISIAISVTNFDVLLQIVMFIRLV